MSGLKVNQFMILSGHNSVGFHRARRTVTRAPDRGFAP